MRSTERVIHSSQYQDGEDWKGKSAIVVGTGNSGHDVAQDLASSGAAVTHGPAQRRHICRQYRAQRAAPLRALRRQPVTLEDTDLIALSMAMPLMRDAHISYAVKAREYDAELLSNLEGIGFKLDAPEGHAGWQFKYLTRGGGYYFNVGCSDMLIEGKIDLIQASNIADLHRGRRDAVRWRRRTKADLIVLATGYQPQEKLVEQLFGAEVKDRVGPIWGLGDQAGVAEHVLQDRPARDCGSWKAASPSAASIPNTWRLQIKACEEGLIPIEKQLFSEELETAREHV